jgi:hypothetical protein
MENSRMSDDVRLAIPARSVSRARRDRMRAVLHRAYDLVHAGLWAIGAALLLWLVFHSAALSDLRSHAEAQRALEITAENRAYCEKWGIPAGTHAHTLCTLDLQELRAKHEQHLLQGVEPFL